MGELLVGLEWVGIWLTERLMVEKGLELGVSYEVSRSVMFFVFSEKLFDVFKLER